MQRITKRILIGAILIALMCLVLAADGWLEEAGVPTVRVGAGREVVLNGAPLTFVVIILVALGYLEFARLCEAAGATVFRLTGAAAAVLIGSLPFWRQAAVGWQHREAILAVLLAGSLLALFVAQLRSRRTDGVIRNVGSSALGVVYLGVCTGVALDVRVSFGLGAFVLFVAVVKATDIGAYLNALGGRAAHVELGPAAGAAFGAVTGLFGQVADLCESALKRAAGMKDSAARLPEFGGVLDIMDSPLLAAPAAYVLLAAAG